MAPVENSAAISLGPDGRLRCWWCLRDRRYVEYHDREWGRPLLSDVGIFEHLTLEAFQSGLSWEIILRKRAAFRTAFSGFRPAVVAAYDGADVARLLQDEGIVRNRRKIEAAINNAGRAVEIIREFGSLAHFFWAFRPAPGPAPCRRADIPAVTEASRRLAAELRRRGLRQLGPTTIQSHMQATGLLNDHVAGCWVREAVGREQQEAAARLGPLAPPTQAGAPLSSTGVL